MALLFPVWPIRDSAPPHSVFPPALARTYRFQQDASPRPAPSRNLLFFGEVSPLSCRSPRHFVRRGTAEGRPSDFPRR